MTLLPGFKTVTPLQGRTVERYFTLEEQARKSAGVDPETKIFRRSLVDGPDICHGDENGLWKLLPANPAAHFSVEYTDTFGGEANYSWVRRCSITVPERATQRQIMTAAKAAAGLTGCAGRTENLGDGYKFIPSGSCTVLFVTWCESAE